MADILDVIQEIGRAHAREAAAELATGEDLEPCGDIPAASWDQILAALRSAGDPRADLGGLGHRSEGREICRAYVRGWDEVAAGHQ